MKKNILIILLGLLIIGVFNFTKIKNGLYLLDKNLGFLEPMKINMFVSENYKDDKIFLSWGPPQTKLHDHIELYQGDTLIGSYREQGGYKVHLKGKNQSYILLKQVKRKMYYSLYTVDRFGRYSKPKSIYFETSKQNYFSKGLFKYTYFDNEINYPYYILENHNLKVTLSRGVLIGIENKDSDKTIFNTNFNFLNSYLTQMDIYGNNIIFGVYRSFYENDFSWIDIQDKNGSIVFTRHYQDSDNVEQVIYSLVDNKTIKVSYHSDFLKTSNAVRINFLGDDNYKAVTKWTANNVLSIIDEPNFDNTNLSFINKQYKKDKLVNYIHSEKIFNDSFPYINSRRFLKISKDTEFSLFNSKNKIFTIYGSTDKYFFYKNCSGEEGFMFGYKFPYQNGEKTIKKDFTVYVKVEY